MNDRMNSKSTKKFSIVLGSYVRSRNACVNCKKSKKKCDEQVPCGLCAKRKLDCGYRERRESESAPGVMELSPGGMVSERVSASESMPEMEVMQVPKVEMLLDTAAEDADIDAGPQMSDVVLAQPEMGQLDSEQNPGQTPSPLALVTSSFNVYLDEAGVQFLQYFEEKVSNLLCIDENTNNYLLKTFLTMSLTEESISHALACWGGIFKESNGLNNSLVRKHYNSSISLISQLNVNNSFNYYILLCFHLILMGIKICLGDTHDWHKIFRNCYRLLHKNGGISALLGLFNNSNDIKWVISNFQYHDILQSKTFVTGTCFPIEQYRLNYMDYGIDPFQGCHNSMILLLGEMLNDRIATVNYDDISTLETFYNKFDHMINECQPLDYQLNLLPPLDRINYLNLFELYKVTVRIILLIHGKLMNPKCLDMQLLVEKGLDLIGQLIDSKLLSSLAFPLFYVGINVTCNNQSRFLGLLHKTYATYNVGNLIRVKQFILLYWERNPGGERYLDWLELIRELDWELYTG